MVTRKDVAERAGVSQSTVSYVISGKRTISSATRQRVERVMKELEYTPNAAARSLAGAGSGIVALHFPVTQPAPSAIEFEYLSSIAQRAQSHGYNLLLWSGAIDEFGDLSTLVGSHMVEGVVLMEVRLDDPRIRTLQAQGVPFTLLGRPAKTEGLYCVDDDFGVLGSLAIDHVADLGHREVLYVTREEAYLQAGSGPAQRTLEALNHAAALRGVGLSTLAVESSIRGGVAAIDYLLSLPTPPTAVVGFNEFAVAGLIQSAAHSGIKIPEDLTVVGLSFPNAMAEILNPPVTTVGPDPKQLAEAAMDMLVELLEGADPPAQCILLEPRLTVRDSSGVPTP